MDFTLASSYHGFEHHPLDYYISNLSHPPLPPTYSQTNFNLKCGIGWLG
jgi:hypothetical protein